MTVVYNDVGCFEGMKCLLFLLIVDPSDLGISVNSTHVQRVSFVLHCEFACACESLSDRPLEISKAGFSCYLVVCLNMLL